MGILHGSVFQQAMRALPAITLVIFLAGCSAADDGSSDSAGTDASSGGSSSGGSTGGETTGGGSSGASDGVPDENSFTLGPETLNPEAFDYFGISVPITAQLGDNLNSYVTDGTVVHFMTEYGSIGDSCATKDSACSVDWLSGLPYTYDYEEVNSKVLGTSDCVTPQGVVSNLTLLPTPVPCPYSYNSQSNEVSSTDNSAGHFGGLGQVYGNRVTVMAWIENGAESFTDKNGDGRFNKGERFKDVGEPFIDHNEDGVYGARDAFGEPAEGAATVGDKCEKQDGGVCFQYGGEYESFVDLNGNGVYDSEGDGIYNGPLCDIEGEGCTQVGTTIFQQMYFLQAGSWPRVGVVPVYAGVAPNITFVDVYDAANYNQVVLPVLGGSRMFNVFVSDRRNGVMPAGTTISVDTSYGEIVAGGECKVLDRSDYGVTNCPVNIKAEDAAGTGVFTVIVKTPKGNETSILYGVSN